MANQAIELHDRLAHMGGLDGTLLTTQPVNVDLDVLTNNIPNRRGFADFSQILWWLEWYVLTGTTAATLNLGVKYDDNSTDTVAIAFGAASPVLSRLVPIYPNVGGRFIKSIQTATWGSSTGTAGNFGVTATRMLSSQAGQPRVDKSPSDWAMAGLHQVDDLACLQAVYPNLGVATVTASGIIELAQG